MVSRMIDRAAQEGAQFVFTPEVTNCVSSSRTHQRAVLSHPESDPVLSGIKAKAVEHGVHILIGSLAVKTTSEDGRFANRSYLIGPDGAEIAQYDKIHMFDVEIDETESFRESAGYRPGTRAIVAPSPLGPIGMCVCYDMRFPLLAHALAQAGAQVLTYPAAFSPVTGAAHWASLLRARAIENGCWVIAPAQTGAHPGTGRRQTYGHSYVVDPWGHVLLDAGTETGVYFCDIDPELVAATRRRVPALQNTRDFEAPKT